jgi:hypothetical protein
MSHRIHCLAAIQDDEPLQGLEKGGGEHGKLEFAVGTQCVAWRLRVREDCRVRARVIKNAIHFA